MAIGCNAFPCLEQTSQHAIGPVVIDGDTVRYTYWARDGSQRVVFDADEVPPVARRAVLVHVEGETTPDLHGAIGWVADLTEATPKARLRPMAAARTRAHAAWSGAWLADWVDVRAETQSARAEKRKMLAEQVEALEETSPEDESAGADSAEPDGEESQGDEAEKDPLAMLKKDLAHEGIALDEVALDRAVRSVGARQPRPRDFGLSVDVRPAWLFVEQGCDACEEAMEAVDDRRAHVLRVSDPTNARTLKALSKLAGTDPAVPTLWKDDTLWRGPDAGWPDGITENR